MSNRVNPFRPFRLVDRLAIVFVTFVSKNFILLLGLLALYGIPPLLFEAEIPLFFLVAVAVASIALSIRDFEKLEIPDTCVLIIMFAAIPLLIRVETLLLQAVIGCSVAGTLWLVGEIAYRLSGREYLGIGDAKLFGAFAFWHPLSSLADLILLASLGGIIAGLLIKKDDESGIPFGPFIAYSGYVLFFLNPIFFVQ